jgi:4-methyl-5(b-hydroxyethyl)-thiazole monophosphate biosynthesis
MKVLVIVTDGFEEIEMLTIVDILRRANIDTTVAGMISTVVEGAHNVRVIADKRLGEINTGNFDALILPGGSHYKNLMNSQTVLNIIKEFNSSKKLIGAICAAPCVLGKAGVLNNRIATIYPGMEKEIPRPRDGKIIVDGNIITANGPGTAIEFSLKIVEVIAGKNTVSRIRNELVI